MFLVKTPRTTGRKHAVRPPEVAEDSRRATDRHSSGEGRVTPLTEGSSIALGIVPLLVRAGVVARSDHVSATHSVRTSTRFLTLDSGVARLIDVAVHRERRLMRQVVNEALRRILTPEIRRERVTLSPLGVAQRRHHVRRADDGLEGGAQAAYRLGRAGFASGCPVRGREPMRLPARITRERWCGSPVREPNADGVLPGVSASGWTPRRDEP